MKKFIKFSHIDQFRQVYKHLKSRGQFIGKDEEGNPIYDESIVPPPVKFYGTVKLHGTNAAVCEWQRERWFQKRSDFVDLSHDNAGFAQFASERKESFNKIFNTIYKKYTYDENLIYCIYGEWFGQGIQNSVAVSQLSKKFSIFDVVICDGENKFHLPPEFIKTLSDINNDIYNVFLFKTYNIEINFEHPEITTEELTALTNEVEEHCPAGLYFGVDGVGEGIVWTCQTDDGTLVSRFKTKGKKHSSSKVKSHKNLISASPDEMRSINEFIEFSLTENRLDQGIKEIFGDDEPNFSGIGKFIKWCVEDVMREEADTISENKFNTKIISNELSNKARNFILQKLKTV